MEWVEMWVGVESKMVAVRVGDNERMGGLRGRRVVGGGFVERGGRS